MKTVGEILKTARVANKLSLEDISRETRINLKYLEAIEANDFHSLPPATFTKGFMQNFAKTIGLDPQNVLAIFRRDYDADERGRIIPRGLAEPVRFSFNLFTPTTTTITLSIIFGLLIVGFFVRQIIEFQSAPVLQIDIPLEQAQVTSPVIISGKTHPQATLTVNKQPITINDNGTFSSSITLSPGEHTLVITAVGRSGKERTIQRVIFVIENPPSSLP
jgi:hypothetical protein